MDRDAYLRRAAAWRSYHDWENRRLPAEVSFHDLLDWVDECLTIAGSNGPVAREPLQARIHRVAARHKAFAALG